MAITSTCPRTATTNTSRHSGYSIYHDRLAGAWFGKGWERISGLHIHSYCLTDAMTEAEARAWLQAADTCS